jgi:hypothetical protein
MALWASKNDEDVGVGQDDILRRVGNPPADLIWLPAGPKGVCNGAVAYGATLDAAMNSLS